MKVNARELSETLGTARILRGQMAVLFAFDIGYQVSLEKLASLFAVSRVQPLSRKRQTPTHLQYSVAPVILELQTNEKFLGTRCSLQATVFDFGAVSMAYRWPLATKECDLTLQSLAKHSVEIYNRNLEAQASKDVLTLVEKITSAIDRPQISPLVEDYYLFIIEQLEPVLRAEDLLAQYHQTLAQVLTFETTSLSRWQREETLNQFISYSEHDLTIVDWNAAIIYDRDYEDTASVLELLNVELLEARYIDATLDRHVSTYADLAKRPARWPIALRRPYRRALHELTEWRIEATVLSERVSNSLKLIGDLYLSRIHSAAAAKVHLPEWETIIFRKLLILDELYERVDDRIRTAQSQALEVIIVVLIIVEVLLALLRH
jgi:hypothetical protein